MSKTKLLYFFLFGFCVPALLGFLFWVAGLIGINPLAVVMALTWLCVVWTVIHFQQEKRT